MRPLWVMRSLRWRHRQQKNSLSRRNRRRNPIRSRSWRMKTKTRPRVRRKCRPYCPSQNPVRGLAWTVRGPIISQKAKHALRALVSLARAGRGESRMIGEISRDQAIPKKFLEQILLELKRAGIVNSRRGRMGGYELLKAPEEITYGEVLRLIDGP